MSVDLIGMETERKTIALAIEQNYNVLLRGETGLGKTYIINELAKINNKKCHRVNLTGEIGINEIIGKWLIKDGTTFWQEGILINAMKQGDWIVFDEINAANAEILFLLNSLLDDGRSITVLEKDNEVVSPHEDFRFFATMNPSEEYVGTKELNASLLSRFHLVLEIGCHKKDIEKRIIKKHVPTVSEYLAEFIVDTANHLRDMKNKGEISYFCSTRDVISLAKCYINGQATGLELGDFIMFCIMQKMGKEDKNIAVEKLRSFFSSHSISIAQPSTIEKTYFVDSVVKKRKKLEEIISQKEKQIKELESKLERLDAELIKKFMDQLKPVDTVVEETVNEEKIEVKLQEELAFFDEIDKE